MKKLLLTSAGFLNPEISDVFLELLNKPTSEIKIIFVPTASRTEEELKYVRESKEELIALGIKSRNIKNLDSNLKVSYNEVKGFDVIYVCGGNTFYLLSKVRETIFDDVIKKFVKDGGLYVGVSAGSIIVGPNIEIAGWGSHRDENDIQLKNLIGLNITNIAVYPHFEEQLQQEVEEFKKKVKYPIVVLNNNQALLILDSKTKIIGK